MSRIEALRRLYAHGPRLLLPLLYCYKPPLGSLERVVALFEVEGVVGMKRFLVVVLTLEDDACPRP